MHNASEVPDPNPLATRAIEIAQVMLEASQIDNRVEGRAMEGATFERMKWESRLGVGLFNACLLGIRRDIAAAGGPGEYLDILTVLAANEC